MSKFRLIFLVLVLSCFRVFGQQLEGANWFFDGRGSYGGLSPLDPGVHLDFNLPGPVAKPFYYEYAGGSGLATVSDKKGNLLFFSSMGHVTSRKVVNNEYQQMPNGNVLNRTGSELIVQNPAVEHEYYIFFTGFSHIVPNPFKNVYDFYVAKVNMQLDNGFGDVVPNSCGLSERTLVMVWWP